ncbi:MAG: 3-deoxy-D-manno-octulosonic acid transferase [Bacteroidaceae bacterium]|nr:3-deoxy-D-manno-octulosonic acid transferase [Bacteroidaceae bacterium]
MAAFNFVCPASSRHAASSKRRKWLFGHRHLLGYIEEGMRGEHRPVIWFHAASLGEYAVVRPVMKAVRGKGYAVVLTFFSPSGYEAVEGTRPEFVAADHVYYLPLDTRRSARRFIAAVRPQAAVFAVSEYWPCFLYELRCANVPVHIVSAMLGEGHYLFRRWASPLRKLLGYVRTIIVHDEDSAAHLRRIGMRKVVLTGDPLFDNAAQTASVPYHDAVIERFAGAGGNVLVAGSVHDKADMGIVAAVANRNPALRVIYVPHEISAERLNDIKASLQGRSLLYSECNETTDFNGVQTLVIDFIGALARIYRFGDFAYVGGGFTPYLHSVVEPVVYGLPVAFGPCVHRKATAAKMLHAGLADVVRTGEELNGWLQRWLSGGESALNEAKKNALLFVEQNIGATETILRNILDNE